MRRGRWLVPATIAMMLIPALACQTVLGALGVGPTPTPSVVEQLQTQLPSLLEGTPPALETLIPGIPPELSTAFPGLTGGTAEPPPDIPLMSETKDLVASQFLVTYTTPATFDEAVAFYEEQMPANGWTEEGSAAVVAGFAVHNYVKGDRTATVTVSSSGGETTILIAIGQK